jgi:thioredoxin-like negative regulator of GroEL
MEAVVFTKQDCQPCKELKPALDALRSELGDMCTWKEISFETDTDNVAKTMSVTKYPTVVLFKEGTEVGRCTGSSRTAVTTMFAKASLTFDDDADF